MATFQSVLRMSTSGPGLRDTATGWHIDSGLEAMLEMHRRADGIKIDSFIDVGFIPSPKFTAYPTILHALADGFKLLAPPTKELLLSRDSKTITSTYEWNWWLVRDEEHSNRFGRPNFEAMKREISEAKGK